MAPQGDSRLTQTATAQPSPSTSIQPRHGLRPRVIVVGSGFAGLAAARALRDSGIEVVVLESRDRIGGRAHTDYTFGFPLDLGAAWLHGASRHNPLAHVVGHLRLPLYKTSEDNSVLYDHDLESFALYTADGRKVEQRLVENVEEVFEAMLGETTKLCEEVGHDMSMKDALRIIVERRPELRLEGVAHDVLQWYACRMEGWFATDLDKLSAQHWEEEELVEGGHGLMVQGYLPVLKHLARGIDIRTNHRVTSIHYGPAGVTITTDAGHTLSAHATIVTAPIGVLKAGTISFSPPLPAFKQIAIVAVGAGLENKIALLFESPFWPNVEFLGLVAPTPYDCGYFLNLHKAIGRPVLVFMPAGALAEDMERMRDEEAVAVTMRILRMALPHAPEPLNHVVTRWGSDPNSLCSYSYDRVGMPMTTYDDLRAPVGTTMFFAGEATSRKFPGTVHGAYSTGVKAAAECRSKLLACGLLGGQEVGTGSLEALPVSSSLSEEQFVPLIMSRL